MRRIRVDFSFPWPFTAEETRELLAWIFQVALLAYLGFSSIELFKTGFVSVYFNLNILLFVVIASGTLATLWPMVVPSARRGHPSLGWGAYFWLSLITLSGAAVVWLTLRKIGWLGGVVSLISGVIIFGLGLLAYLDDDGAAGE
jgi:hypothetical protein